MISKIAEAVFDNCCPGIRYTEEDKVFYEQMIKVVLKTMREPSDQQRNKYFEMRKDVGDIDLTACFNDSVWETMIDAALNE